MAPSTVAQDVATLTRHAPTTPPANGQFIEVNANKRKKTAGEIAFDVSTYGGLSLLGNEVLSTTIVTQAENGALKKWYEPSVNFFKNLKGFNKFDYVGSGRMPYILWATIGGMMLVLPVKWMEDRKGALVRKFDNLFHGGDTDKDPEIAAAHAEMDRAPKQSWVSLWEGRLITVASALVVDAVVGWPQAMFAKLFDGTKHLKDYMSFDRLAVTGARKTVGLFDKEKKQLFDTIFENVQDPAKRYKIDPAIEGKATKVLATGGSLLTLSLALTILFYATSKSFASGQQKRRERKLGPADGIDGDHIATLPASRDASEQFARDDKPNGPEHASTVPASRVGHIEHQSRLAEAPNLQVAGA